MSTNKRSFVFFLDWAQMLKGQPDEIRLAVFDAIIDYVENGSEPTQGTPAYFIFLFIKKQIDRNNERYAEVCEKRAEAGRKHKGNQYTINRNKMEQMEQVFQNGTNGTDNDNEYDNDNDSDIDIEKKDIKEKTGDEKHKYGEYQNVLLTDNELAELQKKCGEITMQIIDNYSQYKEMKGYKCKRDYLAITRWGIRAYHEEKVKNNKQPQPTNGHLFDGPGDYETPATGEKTRLGKEEYINAKGERHYYIHWQGKTFTSEDKNYPPVPWSAKPKPTCSEGTMYLRDGNCWGNA